MFKGKRTVRLMSYLLGGLVMVGGMGGACDLTILPGGVIAFDSVTVELINTTDYQVEPNLYVDADDDASASDIVTDENFVDIGVPLEPGETAQLAFDCDAIGSIMSDHAFLYISDLEQVESDNGPLLTREDDFDCGDIISFIFIDEWPEGVFFTRVERNGDFVED